MPKNNNSVETNEESDSFDVDFDIKTENAETVESKPEEVKPEVKPEPIEGDVTETREDVQVIVEDESKSVDPSVNKRPETVYYDLDFKKYNIEADEVYTDIETKHGDFMKTFNKGKTSQIILMAIMAVAFIGAMILMMTNTIPVLMYIAIGVAVVAAIISFVMNNKVKKQSVGAIDDYIFGYFFAIDSYAFAKSDLSNAKYSLRAKIEDKEVIDSHYYDTILSISSRNRVIGELNGIHLTCTDAAVYNPLTPNSAPVGRKSNESLGFYGKYISYDYKFEDGSILLIGLNESDTCTYDPTYLDGYEKVEVEGLEEHFRIYATNSECVEKFFTEKFKEALKKLVIDERLLDYYISVTPIGMKIALNYSDPMMSVPMQKKNTVEDLVKHQTDINAVISILKSIAGE